MHYITWYHVLVLHVAALLKMLVIYMQQENLLKLEGKTFSLNEYFKDRWDNWAVHYVSMWLLLLVLPPLVDISGEFIPALKDVKDSPSVNILATAVVGYFGFDAVSFILEKFKTK
jgi:hypothetical protein